MKTLLSLALTLFLGTALAQDRGGATDRVVGHSFGKPVLLSELTGQDDEERAVQLGERVVVPALKAYLGPHQPQWMATEHDIRQFLRALDESRKCRPQDPPANPDEDRSFAQVMIPQVKQQRFIYERHGGGRLRFQQQGTEAFDATRRMLLDLERRGDFAITDPVLRQATLGYYLEPRGPLMDDPGFDRAFRIEHLFDPCPRK